MPATNNPEPIVNPDDEFDDEAGFDNGSDDSGYYNAAADGSGYYNAAPYALASNLNRLGYALARSHAQAAVGVSQIVGGVLTSLIDAANVSSRPFHPYAGSYPDDGRRRTYPDDGRRRTRDRDTPRQRRMAAAGPAAASGVVTDGINQAVADALHTFSRVADDFAQNYAPGDSQNYAPRDSMRRSARDRDEPEPRRRARTTRDDVRRAGEHMADAVDDAANRVQTKNK